MLGGYATSDEDTETTSAPESNLIQRQSTSFDLCVGMIDKDSLEQELTFEETKEIASQVFISCSTGRLTQSFASVRSGWVSGRYRLDNGFGGGLAPGRTEAGPTQLFFNHTPLSKNFLKLSTKSNLRPKRSMICKGF